ncbi:MAG: hypothetical protein R2751_17060, partial [Bacteroidales bacterium]
IETDPSNFKGHREIWMKEDGRWFKYLEGREDSYQKALERCASIKTDFPDAFVVALRDGRFIPITEALESMTQ